MPRLLEKRDAPNYFGKEDENRRCINVEARRYCRPPRLSLSRSTRRRRRSPDDGVSVVIEPGMFPSHSSAPPNRDDVTFHNKQPMQTFASSPFRQIGEKEREKEKILSPGVRSSVQQSDNRQLVASASRLADLWPGLGNLERPSGTNCNCKTEIDN